ncbi:hypothetical protein SAMN04488540_1215 [Ferrimonas sediminum]|uniref:Uncharacterized protein n=1 Tax=Ferrimonas sediminum TaxID=718193 RepID=A0A1G8ZTK0_9GAMM|nr:hypothetical protein SAMN04488540_1215 [Ferrimonas sediminum]
MIHFWVRFMWVERCYFAIEIKALGTLLGNDTGYKKGQRPMPLP